MPRSTTFASNWSFPAVETRMLSLPLMHAFLYASYAVNSKQPSSPTAVTNPASISVAGSAVFSAFPLLGTTVSEKGLPSRKPPPSLAASPRCKS